MLQSISTRSIGIAALAPRHPGHGNSTWDLCYRRPAACRSCSRPPSIRSAPASSIAWRGRAATHRFHVLRIQPEREMAGVAQADRAEVTRAAVLRNPDIASGPALLASSRRWRVTQCRGQPVNMRNATKSNASSRLARCHSCGRSAAAGLHCLIAIVHHLAAKVPSSRGACRIHDRERASCHRERAACQGRSACHAGGRRLPGLAEPRPELHQAFR